MAAIIVNPQTIMVNRHYPFHSEPIAKFRVEWVRELVAETFSVANIRRELEAILPGGAERERMLSDYDEVHRLLGDSQAPDEAARIMIEKLKVKS